MISTTTNSDRKRQYMRDYMRDYRQQHREKINAYNRNYLKGYYRKNKDRYKERNKLYYASNKDAILLYMKEIRQEEKELLFYSIFHPIY